MRRRRFLLLGAALALGPFACARNGPAEVVPTEIGSPDGAAPDAPSPAAPDGGPRAGTEPEPDSSPSTDHREEPAPEGDEAPTADDIDPGAYPASAEQWGERVTGVATRLATSEPEVALTLDACGGPGGDGYDEALIEYLIAERIPATLFFNARWVRANERLFGRLAQNPLFEVANHGTEHRPLSVEGRAAYGIAGTASPAAVIDEVVGCQRLIERRTGRRPRHFRAGTAHYDEVAVRIVGDLGLRVAGFDVLGDAGATFTAEQVAGALTTAEAGSIALLHMNHPASGTAEGVRRAAPVLRERGLRFVTLDGHDLQ